MENSDFIQLERTFSNLFEKTSYCAPIDYCINRIYEYDIKMANISMLRQRKYFPEDVLDKLAAQPKFEREKAIGMMIRSQKEIKGTSKIEKIIKKGIFRSKERLFRENGIQDSDVLSIKNDAVFIIGRKLRKTTFGDVEFVLKNSFSAYHMINRIEFYYDRSNKSFVVKGIADEIIDEPDHQKGMLQFLNKVISYLIYDRKDDLRKYLIQFSDQYKSRKLPHQYYRELNHENIYRDKNSISYKSGDHDESISFNYDVANDDMVDSLNITFNYLFYVLPLIRLHL